MEFNQALDGFNRAIVEKNKTVAYPDDTRIIFSPFYLLLKITPFS